MAVCHAEPAPSLSRTQDYGGYLSTSILPARDANQGPMFACGAALSPITDFRLHGTVGRSVSAQGWGGKPSAARGPQVLPSALHPTCPRRRHPRSLMESLGTGRVGSKPPVLDRSGSSTDAHKPHPDVRDQDLQMQPAEAGAGKTSCVPKGKGVSCTPHRACPGPLHPALVWGPAWGLCPAGRWQLGALGGER